MKTLWFDLNNSPHVNFFKPFVDYYLGKTHILVTARDLAETVNLARAQLPVEVMLIGKHGGKSKIKKVTRLLERIRQMNSKLGSFDIALSCGGIEASLLARVKKKIAVAFDDNDISPNWLYSKFVNYAFFPDAIPKARLLKQGFKSESIIQYEGYKEDVYISEFKPDPDFLKTLPIKDYLIVRPENFRANYVRGDETTIVSRLLKILSEKMYEVLYLPRYEYEKHYAAGLLGVYVPPTPLNGLDAVYHSSGVLSGAGTLSREAACLGVPAVSFFPGKDLLAVDRKMIGDNWMFHSRNPEEMVKYLESTRTGARRKKRSRDVKFEIMEKLDRIIAERC